MFQGAESDDPKKWMGRFYYNALRAMDCKPEGETKIALMAFPVASV